MCSKVPLFLLTAGVQLNVLFGRKVDMTLLVEACWMLTGMTKCASCVPVNSMLDSSQFVPSSNSASIIRVPGAENPLRSLKRERNDAWRTYVDTRSANGRHHLRSYQTWCVFFLSTVNIKISPLYPRSNMSFMW